MGFLYSEAKCVTMSHCFNMLVGSTDPPTSTPRNSHLNWKMRNLHKMETSECWNICMITELLIQQLMSLMSMVGCYFQDCWDIFCITRGNPVNIHKKSIAVDRELDHLFVGNTLPWPGLSFTLCYLFYYIQLKVKVSLTKHSFRLISFQYLTHLITQAFLHVQYKYIKTHVFRVYPFTSTCIVTFAWLKLILDY